MTRRGNLPISAIIMQERTRLWWNQQQARQSVTPAASLDCGRRCADIRRFPFESGLIGSRDPGMLGRIPSVSIADSVSRIQGEM
jgi:hypothetical protein